MNALRVINYYQHLEMWFIDDAMTGPVQARPGGGGRRRG